jgi:hypothetical protein
LKKCEIVGIAAVAKGVFAEFTQFNQRWGLVHSRRDLLVCQVFQGSPSHFSVALWPPESTIGNILLTQLLLYYRRGSMPALADSENSLVHGLLA